MTSNTNSLHLEDIISPSLRSVFANANQKASSSSLLEDSNAAVAVSGSGARAVLVGGDGDDTLIGGPSDDTFFPGAGIDRIEGGGGTDTVDFSGEDFSALPGGLLVDLDINSGRFNQIGAEPTQKGGIVNVSGADVEVIEEINDVENIVGTSGRDQLFGNEEDNVIVGGDGDDTLGGSGGNDRLDGGQGKNAVSFRSATGNISVDLTRQGQAQDTGEGIDVLENFAIVFGSQAGNDFIKGDDQDNLLVDLGGNNTIEGGLGNDLIAIERGDNILTGGAGADSYSFRNSVPPSPGVPAPPVVGNHTITDFDVAEDKLLFGPRFETLSQILGNGEVAKQVGSDTLINYEQQASVLLKNVAISDLTAGNFDDFEG